MTAFCLVGWLLLNVLTALLCFYLPCFAGWLAGLGRLGVIFPAFD